MLWVNNIYLEWPMPAFDWSQTTIWTKRTLLRFIPPAPGVVDQCLAFSDKGEKKQAEPMCSLGFKGLLSLHSDVTTSAPVSSHTHKENFSTVHELHSFSKDLNMYTRITYVINLQWALKYVYQNHLFQSSVRTQVCIPELHILNLQWRLKYVYQNHMF